MALVVGFVFKTGGIFVGTGEYVGYPGFSPFPSLFSKVSFLQKSKLRLRYKETRALHVVSANPRLWGCLIEDKKSESKEGHSSEKKKKINAF